MINFQPPEPYLIDADVAKSMQEDIQTGDITAALLNDDIEIGYIITKQ